MFLPPYSSHCSNFDIRTKSKINRHPLSSHCRSWNYKFQCYIQFSKNFVSFNFSFSLCFVLLLWCVLTQWLLPTISFFAIMYFSGYVEMTQDCNNCYIGSTLQPSPCPDCCCTRDVPNTKNCCYKASINHSDDKKDNS